MFSTADLIGDFRFLNLRSTEDIAKYEVPIKTVPRPGFNSTGTEVELMVNAFPITTYPSRTIYQYDVTVGDGTAKRALIKKVWNSNARKAKLQKMIFDGNKLAWSLNQYKEVININVDLDAEDGRPSGRKSNEFRLVVRCVKKVNLTAVDAWLNGRMSFDISVLEALNFLDHLLREYPSQKFISIKRSFYDPKSQIYDLNDGVIALKGIYQAIKMSHPGSLVVNVDVSNTAFWARISIMGYARAALKASDIREVGHRCKAQSDGYGGVTESDSFMIVHNRIRKLIVRPHYKGCPVENQNFTVKGLVNADCRQFTIDYKDRATGTVEKLNLEAYFKKRYNVILEYPELPVVEMTKKEIYYPMEFLVIEGLQRYPWKLDEYQTAHMIKVAVSRPAERLKAIQQSKAALDHLNDPVLKTFGLKVESQMMRTKARVLPNPEIEFGGNQRLNPGTSGRWDLRGKKFFKPNRWPLESWSVGYFPGKRNAVNQTQVQAFCEHFMNRYSGHGAAIASRPLILELKEDIGEAIKRLYDATKTRFKREPQLFLIIVPDRNSFTYLRIKKSCDCRFGVASQVLQSGHVVKNMAQYISNVSMKVNAKLGGTTARAVPKASESALKPGSIIIGADVSHASPGSVAPSMAAVSVSIDPYGSRYLGTCETNQERVEIINPTNIHSMLTPLIREWMSNVGQGRAPDNIYYFRDGVSTGMFSQVLDVEVPHIKEIMARVTDSKWNGKFTVVIANKRHHIRAFPRANDPKASDRFGNPLPGTLIERDVTSPHDWDFILYSHVALQGTSRPVHYHVILDQIGHQPHQLQNMIYDHCYQYMRSTTSVSLFPAIYYAHLVSNRARTHENVPASSGPRSGPEIKLTDPKPKHRPIEPPRLLKIHEEKASQNRLPWNMWFI